MCVYIRRSVYYLLLLRNSHRIFSIKGKLIRIRSRICQEMNVSGWTVIQFPCLRLAGHRSAGTPERQPRRHCAEANESPGIIAFKIRLRHTFLGRETPRR